MDIMSFVLGGIVMILIGVIICSLQKSEKSTKEAETIEKIYNAVVEQNNKHYANVSVEDFNNAVCQMFNESSELFALKQDGYSPKDPLANFRMGAKLMYGDDSIENMYDTLLDWCGKHVAHTYNYKHNAKNARESMKDILVYSAIACVMLDLMNKGDNN